MSTPRRWGSVRADLAREAGPDAGGVAAGQQRRDRQRDDAGARRDRRHGPGVVVTVAVEAIPASESGPTAPSSWTTLDGHVRAR